MYGASDDHTVALFEQGSGLVDLIVKYAFAGFRAASAGYAAVQLKLTDMHLLKFDTLGGKDLLHLIEGSGSVAVRSGASVDNKYLHPHTSVIDLLFLL